MIDEKHGLHVAGLNLEISLREDYTIIGGKLFISLG